MENKYPFILHSHNHVCWWPGNARSQAINNHEIIHLCIFFQLFFLQWYWGNQCSNYADVGKITYQYKITTKQGHAQILCIIYGTYSCNICKISRFLLIILSIRLSWMNNIQLRMPVWITSTIYRESSPSSKIKQWFPESNIKKHLKTMHGIW